MRSTLIPDLLRTLTMISGTEPDPLDLAVADLAGGQGFVDIVPAVRQVGL